MSLPFTLRRAFRSVPTIVPLTNKSILSITGSQAAPFLHGLLSSSVAESSGPFFSAFLTPQGRVLHDVFVFTAVDESTGRTGYLIEYDSATSDTPLLSILKRHVLRSKVKIRDVSSEYNVWAVYGSENETKWETPRNWTFASSHCIEPVWPQGEWPWGLEHGIIRDRRAPGMGKRMLLRKGDTPPEASDHDVGSSGAYLLHRILHGVPEGSNDIPPEQAFPMDSNLDVMGGVDFRKGCYVGQELTVRTYHTGVVRKRILPVVLHQPGEIPNAPSPSTIALNSPNSLDIHAHIIRQPGDDRSIPRPRGTGKLLCTTNGLGLALLRMEHVIAVENGGVQLEITNPQNGEKIQVSHWWPDWWPRSKD